MAIFPALQKLTHMEKSFACSDIQQLEGNVKPRKETKYCIVLSIIQSVGSYCRSGIGTKQKT